MAKKKKRVARPPKVKPVKPTGSSWSAPTVGEKGWNPGGSYAKPTTPAQPGTPATPGQPYAPYQQAEAAFNRDTGNINAYYGTGNAADPFGTRYGSMGQQLSSDYGFREKQGGGYEIDPSNPYSRAAALQKSYEQGQRGASTSMAARGQLYSGALQSSLDHGTRRYGEASHGLQTAYSRSLGELDLQRTDRLAAASDSLANAGQGLAEHYAANPSAAPQAPGAPTAAKYHSVVQSTMNKAQSMWKGGNKGGKDWRSIISILGYDPRPGKPKPPGAWGL